MKLGVSERIRGVLAPVVTPFRSGSFARSGSVDRALPVAAFAELRAGGVWDKRRGELDVGG